MPIKIPDQLPAAEVLGQENIFVMTESRAVTQNIRPLRVLILNLMPKKIETEIQLMRMLSNSPLQVDVDLLRIDDQGVEEHAAGAPGELLSRLRAGAWQQLRRHDHHGGAARAGGVRGGGLLAAHRRDHRVVPSACDLHPVPLLGGAGGAQGACTAWRSRPTARSCPGSIATIASMSTSRCCAVSMTSSSPPTPAMRRLMAI